MDRRVLVGAGFIAAAVIAAVVWFVPSGGVSAPDARALATAAPPVEIPAAPPRPEPPRPRARATVAEAAADVSAAAEDDGPPAGDGAPISVSGLVVDDAGAKVPGATVTAWRMRRGVRTDVVETTSDADGRFVLPPTAKSSRVAAMSRGLRSSEERCGTTDTAMLIRLRPYRSVALRLVRADQPAVPVAGVTVCGADVPDRRTDADGRCSLDVFGTWDVEFGVAPVGTAGASAWHSRTIEIGPDEMDVEFRVEPVATLRGTVTNADGARVVARCEWTPETVAWPRVSRGRQDERPVSATCDASGAFELRGLPAGRGVLRIEPLRYDGVAVAAEIECVVKAGLIGADGVAGSAAVVVTAVRGAVEPEADRDSRPHLDVRLARAQPIIGRVTGPPDAVRGVFVAAKGAKFQDIGPPARTGEDGAFELIGVPEGERVTLTVDCDEAWRMESKVQATAGDRAVEIRMVSAVETIYGTLLDATGAPAAGAVVAALRATHRLGVEVEPSARAVVDSEGRFQVAGVHGESCDIVVCGLVVGRATPGEPLSLRLPAFHTVRGTVRTASRSPIAGTAWIESTDSDWRFSVQVIDGAFEIPAAPAGRVSIVLLVYAPPPPEAVDALRKVGREQLIARWRFGASIHSEARALNVPCDEVEFVIPEPKPR